ncbi:MAG: flagellar type III secretion system pore protein FliP [Pseudomonadota bacterium]
MRRLALLLLAGGLISSMGAAAAEQGLTLFQAAPVAGGQSYSIPAGSLPYVLLLPFLPALILSLSAFTRVAVVFFLLRQGLGNQYAPPNLVLVGLALLLTYFIMQPVVQKIQAETFEPYSKGQLAAEVARAKAGDALKGFMLRQTRADDLAIFMPQDATLDLQKPEAVPFHALGPAFVTSELKTAFQIGFMVILPFLIIDLVVASVLTGMGMVMVPPQMVSLPLKLLLFIMADGWHLLVGSLVNSF